MENHRKYGQPPFTIAVVHGGPGAAGDTAPIARELATNFGILEPLQTKDTIVGQVEELFMTISENGEHPITLIGHSWGAWLSLIVTSEHPNAVKKLILISSGPFGTKYARTITQTRLSRLTIKERNELKKITNEIATGINYDINRSMVKLTRLIIKTDNYNLLRYPDEDISYNYDIFQKIWPEADELRNSGELLKRAQKIKCPVIAIHGDFDPHPAIGVKLPLSEVLCDFQFILIKNCGHYPWLEREARDEFFSILRSQL